MNVSRFFPIACAAIAALLLSACGGGGSASTAVPLTIAPAGTTSASFVIHIPNASATTSSALRRAQYISASTQSVSIGITPTSGCITCSQTSIVTANLSPSATNCSNGGSGTTCTVPFNILPGTYTFNITTYSGPLSGASPTGNALSTDAGLGVTILNGQANAIGVTLNGIPATLNVTVNTPDPAHVFAGNTLYVGAAGAIFAATVNPLDASGNLITGMGTTTLTTTLVHGTPSAAINAVAIANTQFLDVVAGNTANLNVDVVTATLHGAACSLPGAVCTQAINLRFTQYLAIIDGNSVGVYTTQGAYVGSPTSGVSTPVGVTFDAAGRLVVANAGNDTVTAYSEPFSRAPFGTVTGVTSPRSMTSTIDGEVLVASTTSVYEVLSPYAAISGTLTGFNFINFITTDNVDSLYVVDSGAAQLLKYTLPYFPQATNLAYTTATTQPGPIVVNSTNEAFVAGRGAGAVIKEYDPSGALLGTTLPMHGVTPNNMSINTNDDIALFDQGVSGVDTYKAPGYADTLAALPSGTPRDGVFDVFGNLYVSNGFKVYQLLAPSLTAGLVIPTSQGVQIAIYPRR